MSDLISRQAAVDALDVLCQEHRYKIPGKIETYSQYNEAWQDALDRAEGAIFNLPSVQPEKRTETHACDLIDRQAAIDTLMEILDRPNHAEFLYTDEICKALGELPSAQPERKTGHWIFCDESCKCSICGEDPMIFVETTGFNSALMDREYPMRFCPNCGAKMEVNK